MTRYIRNAALFTILLLLQSCSDLGTNPEWSSWPGYGYHHLSYALPAISGSVGPTAPDTRGIWTWGSDTTGSLWLQFVYAKVQGNLYMPTPGDQVTDIVRSGYIGQLYTTNIDKKDRWYQMVYFPKFGDSDFQFVLYLTGLKNSNGDQLGRETADQIIASISFSPSGHLPM